MAFGAHKILFAMALVVGACAETVPPPVAIERATRLDALLTTCGFGQAAACVTAGLRYLRDSRHDPFKRIGAGKLFQRACLVGRADGCHAAGLVMGVLDALKLHDLACEHGFRAGCERAEDLRRGKERRCEPGLVDRDGANSPLPKALVLPHPQGGVPLIYPPEALAAAFEGEVKLCVHVSPSGAVSSAEIVGDLALLGEAARATVLTWRYPPLPGAFEPFGVVREVIVRFRVE